ncbi:cytochrome b/b6 domain-containing protein [Streptomyces sp. NPDC054796]
MSVPVPDAREPRLTRFTRAERWAHHATGALFGLCVGTALCLYVPGLAQLVGRRRLMVTLHEWSGLLLPAPVLLGLASRALRADLRRLNRFAPHDRRWLRAALLRRRRPVPAFAPQLAPGPGKFNAGQKVYAAWLAGAVLVMTATGLMMWFTHLTPLLWRTSATFVHDWLALAIGLALLAHIGLAYADPEARRGIRTGTVARPWARREHPLWEREEREEWEEWAGRTGAPEAAEKREGPGT